LQSCDSGFPSSHLRLGIGLIVARSLVIGCKARVKNGSVVISAALGSASCEGPVLQAVPTTYTGATWPCPRAAMKTRTCVLRLRAPAQYRSGQQRK